MTTAMKLVAGKMLLAAGKLVLNANCCCGVAPPPECGGCPAGTIPALIGLSVSGFTGNSACAALNGDFICSYDSSFNFCIGAGCCYAYYFPTPVSVPIPGSSDTCDVTGWGICICQAADSGPDAGKSFLRLGMLPTGGGYWFSPGLITNCDDPSGYTLGDFDGSNCGMALCTTGPATITATVIA